MPKAKDEAKELLKDIDELMHMLAAPKGDATNRYMLKLMRRVVVLVQSQGEDVANEVGALVTRADEIEEGLTALSESHDRMRMSSGNE